MCIVHCAVAHVCLGNCIIQHKKLNIINLYCFIDSLYYIFNRPGVAGAVLETPPSLIDRVSKQSFSSKSSKHHKFQTITARHLKCLHKVHHQSCVMCHMSCITCHVSCVMCHVSCVTCHVSPDTCNLFYFFFLQINRASRWRACYQRGLPRLVYVFFF